MRCRAGRADRCVSVRARWPSEAPWSTPTCRRSPQQVPPRYSSIARLGDRHSGVDECEMDEPLRDVAQQLVGARVELFCVEADVVGKPDNLLHEVRGLLEAPDAGERIGKPEGAAQERALPA